MQYWFIFICYLLLILIELLLTVLIYIEIQVNKSWDTNKFLLIFIKNYIQFTSYFLEKINKKPVLQSGDF